MQKAAPQLNPQGPDWPAYLSRYIPGNVLEAVHRVFCIDLRALAFFRIGLGLLMLANLAILATDLEFFYTDSGIMPRRVWALATHSLHWSLHAASGELWFQIIWFSVSALAAILLVIGYRTRLMSVICWALLVSLINRNHFILQAGDQLLVILAFWSMFLPLHARYSVDAALQDKYTTNPQPEPARHDSNSYFSVATVALVLQVLYLYFFTALLKTGAPWRETFDAAFYAVSLEHFATPIGAAMRDFGGFLKFGTGYVLLVEFIAPLLVLCPWFFLPLRLLAVATLYSLHVGFLLMLHIGLFPLIDFVALLVLLPGPFWDWLARVSFRADRLPASVHVNRECTSCYKVGLILREWFLPSSEAHTVPIESGDTAPEVPNLGVTTHNQQRLTGASALVHIMASNRWFKPLAWLAGIAPVTRLLDKLLTRFQQKPAVSVSLSDRLLPWRSIRLRPRLLTQLTAAFFLYAVTVTNLASLKTLKVRAPEHVRSSIKAVRLDQRWGMFAPKPLVYSVHPVIAGTLRNGQEVDLFNNSDSEPQWEPPTHGYSAYPGYRTRKLYERVDGKVARVAAAYGDYLCRRWNHPRRAREKQLGLVDIYTVRRRTNTTGEPKKQSKHQLWQHWCYPEFAPKKG